MDYIKGRLTILDKIGQYIDTGKLYYGASDFSYSEVTNYIESIIPNLVSIDVPELFNIDGVILPFTTANGQIIGRYGILIYPAIYGKLEHIYCLYDNQADLHIDLIKTWQVTTVSYNNVDYLLYIQDRRTKDKNLKYKFLLERGEH